jgi:ABC-type nitrate/sulfonate/bicarbonate transport system ATPase subunit
MKNGVEIHIESMRYPGMSLDTNLIENIDIQIPGGAVVSFIGPSGSGKTTLFRIISGLEPSYCGYVAVNGEKVYNPGNSIQIVFQDNRLIPWKNVFQNIKVALNNNLDFKEKNKLVYDWLEKLKISNINKSYPMFLSGGEESRVAFARTFINPPDVLLLDEPFINVDLPVKFLLQNELLSLLDTKKTTVLFVSHSIEDAVFLSDKVYLLSTRPMKVQSVFEVLISKPRDRHNADLISLTEQIKEQLIHN